MDFEFDGKTLSSFGMIMFYDGVREEQLAVSGMAFETIKSALSDISLKAGYSYNENYSTTLLIMKNCCEAKCIDDPERPYYSVNGTNLTITLGYCENQKDLIIDDKITCDDEQYLTDMEISTLTKWLVRKQYKWFKWSDRYVYYKAQNVIEKIYYGEKVIGLAVTVNTNAPYGFTDELHEEFTGVTEFEITNQTDEEGYIYPDMEVTVNEDGDLILTNEFDGSITIVGNVVSGEKITFRGNVQEIESTEATHELPPDFNFVFPRLCNLYGSNVNNFTSNLSCNIDIKYRGIRKVGL